MTALATILGLPSELKKEPESGDSEMQQMLASVDLLGLIQSDTGENGRTSGDRIDFDNCPICHHRGCFSYYPSTNSWHCFGDSNTTGYEGGSALTYYKATRHDDNVDAVKWLRDQTGHPYEKNAKGKTVEAFNDGLLLPPWTSIQSTEPPKRNPVLVDGVVRQGHIMLVAGKGKIGKSWSAIELCVSLATGRTDWLGLSLLSSGACLYIDPELDYKSLDNRFKTVCDAMGADTSKVDASIVKWCLRGIEGANMDSIIHDLSIRCEFRRFSLVVIDSCSAFVEGDENSSICIRAFASKVLRVSAITGATVLLVHHFGKAKDGDRSAADRARGSSVWLDFPDAVLTLTEILPPSGEAIDYLDSGEYACLLESGGIREFPRIEPIHLVFSYPLHRVDFEGITDGWKPDSSSRRGAEKTNELKKSQAKVRAVETESALLAFYYAEGIGPDGLILKDAASVVGLDSRALANALEGSDYFDVVQVTQRKRYVRAKNPPSTSELPLEH